MYRSTIARPAPPAPRHALVVAFLALFVACAAPGYAADLITGKQVKNSSLTGKDVKDATLTGNDVANESLTGGDLAAGSVSAADVAPDSLGGGVVNEAQLGPVPHAIDAGMPTTPTSSTVIRPTTSHASTAASPARSSASSTSGQRRQHPGIYTSSRRTWTPTSTARAPPCRHAGWRWASTGEVRSGTLPPSPWPRSRTDSDSNDADLCKGSRRTGPRASTAMTCEVAVTTCDFSATPRRRATPTVTLLLP